MMQIAIVSLSMLVLNCRDQNENYGFLKKVHLESNLTTMYSFKLLHLNLLV